MWQLTIDQALADRLQAIRDVFLRLEGGEKALSVRLPGGEVTPLGLQGADGLYAAGVLLAYALLGDEAADAEDAMAHLSQFAPDRPLRKVCDAARQMLARDPLFSQASLYAALRSALSYLPEPAPGGRLPGLIQPGGREEKPKRGYSLKPRFAWAGDAAIAYFDLPEGVEVVSIGQREYTRAQCLAGVCLAPGQREIQVEWEGGSGLLAAEDPLADVTLKAGFRLGPVFLPAHRVPGLLWGRLTPVILAKGPRNGKTPEMKIVSSCGQMQETPCLLPQGRGFLRCPPLDPRVDRQLEIYAPGLRYLDITGEG